MAFCKLLSALVLIHNIEVSVSIMGGSDAPKGSWPWMVHINMSTHDRKTNWRCGGTLISDQWVLTAAHCLDEKREPSYYRSMVWVGSHALQKESVRYMAIHNSVRHPFYQAVSDGFIYDIALIKLKKKVKFSKIVSPVSLARVDDTFGPSSECWITGWGEIGNGVPLPDPETLQQLKISLMPQTNCEVEPYQTVSWVLLAGDEAGGKDACNGDFGGPLVCRTARGFVQLGIMSYGSFGRPESPGVYTRVSKYLCFIERHLRQ